jgi:hypothetical protein
MFTQPEWPECLLGAITSMCDVLGRAISAGSDFCRVHMKINT